MFGLVNWAARKGLTESSAPPTRSAVGSKARRTGVRGETYAYWYLRRNGYIMIARNFTYRGMKGEIDLVGYDGATLAFVEVKTRTPSPPNLVRQRARCRSGSSGEFREWPGRFVCECHASDAPSDLTFWRSKACPAG